MYTLGINAVFHDSSACLVENGRVLAAAEEERFTGIKHGKRPIPFSTYELPFNAIDFCLKTAGVSLKDIHHVAYSFNPYLLLNGYSDAATVPIPLDLRRFSKNGWENPWDPLFLSLIVNAPGQLADGAPHHLRERFAGVKTEGTYRWHFVDHHVAHAASASLASPFSSAAILTLDGRGERATTTYNFSDGVALCRLGEVTMPNSLGLLYERLTTYLGFLHSSDEYKVMALASYGKPVYRSVFRDAIRLSANAQYEIANIDLERVFGPARARGGAYEQKHFDIAHSLQVVLEETVLDISSWLFEQTHVKNLCLAGGVALNCVMNARIRDRGKFKNVWVQPAAGDAGTSLGAALWVDAQERKPASRAFHMNHAYFGPSFSDPEIEETLKTAKLNYRRSADIAEDTAELLAENKVIGWFQGKMEFGPRALGARSIIASPIPLDMQARLNDIKDREDFRPVAPSVLEEKAGDWFEGANESPFMLFVFDVKREKADKIPAVRHVDGTARVQTVRRGQNAVYYDMIRAFERRTGVPIVINTSFNTLGRPIVCKPRDALESFFTSPLDALVIGSFIVEKNPTVS